MDFNHNIITYVRYLDRVWGSFTYVLTYLPFVLQWIFESTVNSNSFRHFKWNCPLRSNTRSNFFSWLLLFFGGVGGWVVVYGLCFRLSSMSLIRKYVFKGCFICCCKIEIHRIKIKFREDPVLEYLCVLWLQRTWRNKIWEDIYELSKYLKSFFKAINSISTSQTNKQI